MDDRSFAVWETFFSIIVPIGMVACAVWFMYVYGVLLVGLSRGRSLELAKFERRFERAASAPPAPLGADWSGFRDRHLASANAVWRSQGFLSRIAAFVALIALIAGLATAVLLFIAARHVSHGQTYNMVAFAIVFLSPVPCFGTWLTRIVLWRFRARTEWRVVLIAEQLLDAVTTDAGVDQDYVARRTGLLLTRLYKRFRPGTWEQQAWRDRLSPAAEMHVELRMTDDVNRRRWTRWVRRWLDEVASAFTGERSRNLNRSHAAAQPGQFHDTERQVLVAVLVLCCGLGAGALTVVFVRTGDLDLSSVSSAWGAAIGTASTIIGAGASLAGVLTYFGRRRANRR